MARHFDFRLGDRAEGLGIVLMQVFCYMVLVPRPEDAGVFDAIATLIRREGKRLYAEETFLVQFKTKSRYRNTLTYESEKFDLLLNLELSLMIGIVDLTKACVELYNVGNALAHSNIIDAESLLIHFNPMRRRNGLHNNILHSYHPPILELKFSNLTKPDKEIMAYQVMKEWLKFDYWNRRYRKVGCFKSVSSYETNKVPYIKEGFIRAFDPGREHGYLTEMIQYVQLMSMMAYTEHELVMPVIQITDWMRSKGVDPDPGNILRIMMLAANTLPFNTEARPET